MDRLQAMRQFVAVVDAGSFSAAARQLALGQPAVSKTVAQLEQRLGVRLLARSTRSHALTDAGQRFYEHARIALDEADAADAAARDEGASLRGRLRISAPPVYASLHVVPRLAAFLAAHPGLAIDLVLDDRRIDLVEEGVDLAIRAGDLADSTLVARRIDRARRHLVGTPAYFERHGTPRTPADLQHHAVIGYTGYAGPAKWAFSRHGRTVEVAVMGSVRVSAAEGLRAALLAGLGLAIASERMVAPELANGALRCALQGWTLPEVDVWALYPTGRRPTARARRFVDWLAGELSAAAVQARGKA